jgi:hypothetical protein
LSEWRSSLNPKLRVSVPIKGWIWVRGEFAVGHVVAENLEVAVVELLVVFAVEFAQCFGLVGLARRNGADRTWL